jgi:hypothetical protein
MASNIYTIYINGNPNGQLYSLSGASIAVKALMAKNNNASYKIVAIKEF